MRHHVDFFFQWCVDESVFDVELMDFHLKNCTYRYSNHPDGAGISLDQSNHIDQLFDKYSSCLLPCRNYSDLPTKRGHIHREELPATERQKAIVNEFPYSEITGAVLYLSVVTRLDISFAVGVLVHHLIFMYVYSDSDWGSDLDSRRSTSGYVVMMAGGPISWMSKLQPIVATSAMEAEYVSAYPSVREVAWIRAVLHYLELTRDKPTEYVSAYPSVREVTWIRAVLYYLVLTRDKPTTLLIDNKSALISPTTLFTINVQSTLALSTTGYETRLQIVQLLWFMFQLLISVPIF
jgi:hypothetical protein